MAASSGGDSGSKSVYRELHFIVAAGSVNVVNGLVCRETIRAVVEVVIVIGQCTAMEL